MNCHCCYVALEEEVVVEGLICYPTSYSYLILFQRCYHDDPDPYCDETEIDQEVDWSIASQVIDILLYLAKYWVPPMSPNLILQESGMAVGSKSMPVAVCLSE
jgi:hypothetical protein